MVAGTPAWAVLLIKGGLFVIAGVIWLVIAVRNRRKP
jgi:hypothetical protein